MYIRDPIYKIIEFDDVESRILSSERMQRLYYIKQLGLTYLVYPSGMHTRLEHSIGTMHLTKEVASKVYGRRVPEFEYAGLLHDIGHGPFSHQTEYAMKKYLHKSHEEVGKEIVAKSEIKDIISDAGFSIRKVMSYFDGGSAYEIVGGILGSDRLDYLMRDSYHIGVAYGIIDYARLINNFVLKGHKLAVYEHAIAEAESILIARYFMYSNVYMHHTVLIAEGMLRTALEKAIENGEFDPKELVETNDNVLLYKLHSTSAANIVKNIERRVLFKRAYYGKVRGDVKLGEIENALSNIGLNADEYVVKLISLRDEGREDIPIVDKNGELIGKLTDFSPFIKTLEDVLKKKYQLLVACDKSKVDEARKAVSKVLH